MFKCCNSGICVYTCYSIFTCVIHVSCKSAMCIHQFYCFFIHVFVCVLIFTCFHLGNSMLDLCHCLQVTGSSVILMWTNNGNIPLPNYDFSFNLLEVMFYISVWQGVSML